MRILIGLCFFYQKLILYSLLLSVSLSLVLTSSSHFFMGTGIAYMLILPTAHYFSYDIRKPQEYFFYYNLGISKLALWLTTVVGGAFTGLLLTQI